MHLLIESAEVLGFTGKLLYHAGGVRAGVVDCGKRVEVPDNVETRKIPTTSRTQPLNCLLACFIDFGFVCVIKQSFFYHRGEYE